MLVPGDLGFQSLVLVFFVFFTLIVTLIIRYKWRIATARTQEIVRLVAMAAEEKARVEHEAVVDYYVPVSVAVAARHSQCTVCYYPTSTRCSRCKAIRYYLSNIKAWLTITRTGLEEPEPYKEETTTNPNQG